MGRAANRKRFMRTLKRAAHHQAMKEVAKEERAHGSVAASVLSPQSPHGPSRWDAQPAARRELLEEMDTHAWLRNKLREVAAIKEEWAGIPLVLEGEQLVIEPRYPFAGLSTVGAPKPDPEEVGAKIRNTFHSMLKGRDVIVWEKDGKIEWGAGSTVNHGPMELRTLGCADAWGIEQESNAVHLLGTLVTHRQFKQYMLTGMFLESSKRSGTFYLFRRLRPTLAISERGDHGTHILAAMCMHPIGYYAGTWAGAMCPTDDVVAHLMLMRGDEHLFWRRCNQHPAWRPEAGL